ncbi:MAG: hypothetical protein R3B84_15555 [Zavarzinella sp.]
MSHRSAYVDRLDRRTEYAYDVVGQLLTETWKNSGGSTVEEHDYLWYDDGGTYTFTYDDLGRVSTHAGLFGKT